MLIIVLLDFENPIRNLPKVYSGANNIKISVNEKNNKKINETIDCAIIKKPPKIENGIFYIIYYFKIRKSIIIYWETINNYLKTIKIYKKNVIW